MANLMTLQELSDKVGELSEIYNDKVDRDGMNAGNPCAVVVEISDKSLLPSWYRVYSDGWCEQGGITSSIDWNNGGDTEEITLLKEMANTDYTKIATMLGSSASWNTPGCAIREHTTTTITIGIATYSANQGTAVCSWFVSGWQASGYIE